MTWDAYDIGYDIPAHPGMAEADIQTPCLIVDLDILEANLHRLAAEYARLQRPLRMQAQAHNAADIYFLQQKITGAQGLSCQSVSAAEAFLRTGVRDILVTAPIRDPRKVERLGKLSGMGRLRVCLDDPANVPELSEAALNYGGILGCLIAISCGQTGIGVRSETVAVEIAQAIEHSAGLRFDGLQINQGNQSESGANAHLIHSYVQDFRAIGLPARMVTGAVAVNGMNEHYTEVQTGLGVLQDALFVLAQVIGHAQPDHAILDVGLAAYSMHRGLPRPIDTDVSVIDISGFHCTVHSPEGRLAIGDRQRLAPGDAAPISHLHNWYVGLRSGVVECVWPVTARGKTY